MHDIINNKLDKIFCNLFQLTKNRHNILTRQATSDFFVQPAIRTNITHQSILINGVKIWNSILFDIRQSENKRTFEKNYKAWLLKVLDRLIFIFVYSLNLKILLKSLLINIFILVLLFIGLFFVLILILIFNNKLASILISQS